MTIALGQMQICLEPGAVVQQPLGDGESIEQLLDDRGLFGLEFLNTTPEYHFRGGLVWRGLFWSRLVWRWVVLGTHGLVGKSWDSCGRGSRP